jgi:glycerophosphoryl diester phosphodiesterase
MKSTRIPTTLFILIVFVSHGSVLLGQIRSKKLVVIAHRGDHTAAPENTLKAFQDAIATGVDFVEVDVRSSKDGELVVMHDATVNRMTEARGKVEEFTLQELKKLTVADKQRPELGKHSVPTFAEVLDVCKGKMGIYIDFKGGDVAKAWRMIRDRQMESRVIVYINEPDQYPAWRAQAPSVPLMVSLPDSVRDEGSYKKFHQAVNADIMDGGFEDYTPELVKAVNRNGQVVWVDVQSKNEDAAHWNKVLALGVQGMQTDHPRELVRWRKQSSR